MSMQAIREHVGRPQFYIPVLIGIAFLVVGWGVLEYDTAFGIGVVLVGVSVIRAIFSSADQQRSSL